MWYGSYALPNLAKSAQNKSNRLNWKSRRAGVQNRVSNSYAPAAYAFKLPINWKLVVLRALNGSSHKLVFYLYTQTYFLNLVLLDRNNSISYDSQTHSIELQKLDGSYSYFSFLRRLADVFQRFHKPFFLKIKFKGKGYYMYKNKRNTIAPQFGYAHRVYIYSFANSVKFLSKTKVFLFGLSQKDIFSTGYGLFRTRPINVFTGRGVRFARQVVYKKTGKIGAYR
jgi:hypothetical protein